MAGRKTLRQECQGTEQSSGADQQELVSGYLSGRAGVSGGDFLKGTDNDSIFLWLDNYCRANPQMDLEQAGIDLARELMQLKGIKP